MPFTLHSQFMSLYSLSLEMFEIPCNAGERQVDVLHSIIDHIFSVSSTNILAESRVQLLGFEFVFLF